MLHTKTHLAACLVLVFAAGAAPAASSATSYMEGTWFGHGQPDSKDSMYIDRMHADGRWGGEYRTCVKGKPVDQVQMGRWSLKGDILSLQVDTVNGVPMPHTDAYKILAHSEKTQKYVSLNWNFPYTPQRVANDFQMPSCELTS
jgi:hypothetical protein